VFHDRANRIQNMEVESVEEAFIDNALTAYSLHSEVEKAIK